MLRHLPAILLFVILPYAKISAQQREQITHTSGPKNTRAGEEYEVLKDDTAIKDGQYKLLRYGRVILSGFYDHGRKDSVWEAYYGTSGIVISRKWYAKGQRTGQWDFCGAKGNTEWSYNFTTGMTSVQRQVQPFSNPSACYYPADSGAWANAQPDKPLVALAGSGEWYLFLNRTLRYPDETVNKEIMGEVIISVTVDENGAITDYGIAKSAAAILDAEALRIVKLFPFEFIPAEKDGKKIKAQLRVPINFKLESGN
jgi:TonB family protein